MLIFDQLKKDDPQLRLLALMVLAGLGVLAAGLWWVQIVSSREYQAHMETQSYRTIRVPAVRGKILDRNGAVLAENRPTYNISLYFEELRRDFEKAANREIGRAKGELSKQMEARQHQLGRKLKKEEKKAFLLSSVEREALRDKARVEVASNVVAQVSQRLHQPLTFNPTNFIRHFKTNLALPYPILTDLTPDQISRFEEQSTAPSGVDIEIQSRRTYPGQTLAAHVLGSLRATNGSVMGEQSFYTYRLPDYGGVVGIERGFDKELRGAAGTKSVLVNSIGYRQTETVWTPAEPGENVVLTIDSGIQKIAEKALAVFGVQTRGAVVVMDVNTGDILAMASSPTLNPADAIPSYTRTEWDRLQDPILRPQINRATQDNYQPGSIFKIVVGLACLEAGMDPREKIFNSGHIVVGGKPIKDDAAEGEYDFIRALAASSNTYFISNGLRYAGMERIIALAQRFHLGERTKLPTKQEVAGIFPTVSQVRSRWYAGDTAQICIGQGFMAVTPLQVAVYISAIANGGKVLWPRLVMRIEPQTVGAEPSELFPAPRIRDELGVSPRNLELVREAMLEDVEGRGTATGKAAYVPGMRICGKTGTAQKKNAQHQLLEEITWFASFAPFDHPRYAVVVMVEHGISGGKTCAPVAKQIYTEIQKRESSGKGLALSSRN